MRGNQLALIEELANTASKHSLHKPDELDQIAESIEFAELQEHSEMTSLFPTFTSIWQRAKQILSSDISPIIEAIKADWAEYQVAVQKEGLDPFGDQFF